MADLLTDTPDDVLEPTIEDDLADTGEDTVEAPDASGEASVAGDDDSDDAPDPVDEWASASPMTYTIDGKAQPFAGIKVINDANGQPTKAMVDLSAQIVVDPVSGRQMPALQALAYKLSRYDHQESANKSLYAKTQEFDRLGGVKALETAHIEAERMRTAVTLMASYLDYENPDKLIALAYAVQNGDRSEYDRLIQGMKDQTTIAQYKARETWGTKAAQTTSADAQQAQRAEITMSAIAGSVSTHAPQFSSLTPKDLEQANAHFARLGSAVVRPATPDEAQAAGVKPGELIVDHPVIYDWLKDRNDLRAEQARTASSSSTTATENARRLKAATPPKRTASTGKRATVPAEPEMTWQQQRDQLMAGGFSVPDTE